MLKSDSSVRVNAITNVKNVATPRTSCSESDVSNHPFIVFDTFYRPIFIMFVMVVDQLHVRFVIVVIKSSDHISQPLLRVGSQSQLKP